MRYWRPYSALSPAERKRKNKRSYKRRKRAKGSHTDEEVRLQYCLQDGLCYWCMKEVGDDFHRDHYIPIARGGTSHAYNIVISCPHCNLSRGSKLPEQWTWRKVHAYWGDSLCSDGLLQPLPRAGRARKRK
jgi:5-methylcytosine-specific restriction endonuclease McrA